MKGKILIIGGNVDKGTVFETRVPKEIDYLNFFEQGILESMLSEIEQKDLPIEIITSASFIPDEVGEEYLMAFRRLGKEKAGVLNPVTREEADYPDVLNRIKKCSALIFTGGDQHRLEKIFTETRFLQILKNRLNFEKDFLVAGTSAGAMAFSKEMIRGGDKTERIVKGGVIWGNGFGLIKNIVIDTHFCE